MCRPTYGTTMANIPPLYNLHTALQGLPEFCPPSGKPAKHAWNLELQVSSSSIYPPIFPKKTCSFLSVQNFKKLHHEFCQRFFPFLLIFTSTSLSTTLNFINRICITRIFLMSSSKVGQILHYGWHLWPERCFHCFLLALPAVLSSLAN